VNDQLLRSSLLGLSDDDISIRSGELDTVTLFELKKLYYLLRNGDAKTVTDAHQLSP
jgi:hypothetical protein